MRADSAEKVSVIVPTWERPDRHANLYTAFHHQSYPLKELLVFDDSAEPSPFFAGLDDPEVVYRYSPSRISQGRKRDELCAMATGGIIAHFDDDDYYAPVYLSTMVEGLGDADFVTLTRWLSWRELDRTLWDWDTATLDGTSFVVAGATTACPPIDIRSHVADPQDWVNRNSLGFGFTYLYRRSVWGPTVFGDTQWGGMDYDFAAGAQAAGAQVVLLGGDGSLVLHVLHGANTSNIFPQRQIPVADALKLLGVQAAPWLAAPAPGL